jgi:hypothetical protein
MEKAVRKQLADVTDIPLMVVRFSAETGLGVNGCWDALVSLPRNQA